GLERAPLLCRDDLAVHVGADLLIAPGGNDDRHVFGAAAQVLLPVAGAGDRGLGRHDDAGKRAVHAAFPRSFLAARAVRVIGGRVLAEVPHIAVVVLRVPVVSVFRGLATDLDQIVDDGGGDTHHGSGVG